MTRTSMPTSKMTSDLRQDEQARLHRTMEIRIRIASSAQLIKSSRIQRTPQQSRGIIARLEALHISQTIHQLMENYNQAGEEDKRPISSYPRKFYPITSRRSQITLRLPIINSLRMLSLSRALRHNGPRMEALLPSRLSLIVRWLDPLICCPHRSIRTSGALISLQVRTSQTKITLQFAQMAFKCTKQARSGHKT